MELLHHQCFHESFIFMLKPEYGIIYLFFVLASAENEIKGLHIYYTQISCLLPIIFMGLLLLTGIFYEE